MVVGDRMATYSSHQQTRILVQAAAAACEDKKGADTRILELDPVDSGLADFFLITSATNDRQAVAIADEIEMRLKRDFGATPNSIEGRRQAEWILMDYVDFIVHVFSAEKRAFYGLERLRKSATTISIAALNAELKAKITTTRAKNTKKAVAARAPVKKTAKKTAKKAAIPKKTASPSKAATNGAAKRVKPAPSHMSTSR